MGSIGMPQVHPPTSWDTERSLPAATFLQPAKNAMAMGFAQNPEAYKYMKSVTTGMGIFEYLTGIDERVPLEASKISAVKEDVRSLLGRSISARAITNIFAQTILIGTTYLGYFEMLSSGESSFRIPYGEFLIPAAKLYGQIQESTQIIQNLIQSKDGNDSHLQFVKLLGCLASALLYGGQIAVYAYISQLSAKAELTLGTVAYLASIYEILSTEYNHTSPILGQVSQTPTLHMKV